MNLTEAFIRYLQNKNSAQLPPAVISQAKKCLIDYLGVAAAGNCVLRDRMADYISRTPRGNVKIIGCDVSVDGLSAAFVNGFGSHVLELDDGHRFGMIHLAAPIISAVLSAVQMEQASSDDLIRGIVMGYEAAVRLAISLQPEHKKRGFHTAGTCGTVGAAVGVAFACGYDFEQLKAAISAAGTSAAGLLEIQEDASELKPYNVAHAAMSGLNAALAARAGFAQPDDLLGGRRGLTRVLSDGSNEEKMLFEADYYEIERIYFKPYAACRHCHSAIEAALELRNKKIYSKDIESITVDTYQLAVRGHDHTDIKGESSAKLSIPYSVAAAYITGGCGIDAFAKSNVDDEEILALTRKVSINENPKFTECSPEKRIAEVSVVCKDGTRYVKRVDYAKGDPENPMSLEDIRIKFRSLMTVAGRENAADRILRAVEESDLKLLFELI